jgi:RNA polymerase sigma-70 factor, ECF subfamily
MQAGIAVGNVAGVAVVRTEEAALVAELKAGSEEAFAWLIATYNQRVYSLVARTIPEVSDAADLTQEIFIKIYRGIGSFQGDASLRTWIYRIALHEALNGRRWWRRHKRREVTIEADTDDANHEHPLSYKEMLVDHQQSPFEFAAQEQIRHHVESQLKLVAEPFRTVLVLRDIEGFTYEEIAEVLGVQLGTVKSRLLRGRNQLKTLLTPFAEAAAKRPVRAEGSRTVFGQMSAEEAR